MTWMRRFRLRRSLPAAILHSPGAGQTTNPELGPACIIRILLEITMTKIASLTHHSRRSVLAKRQTLVLVNAQGTIVAVDRGSVWITLERDPRDIVLVKGMRFEIDRPGRTIIAAETD